MGTQSLISDEGKPTDLQLEHQASSFTETKGPFHVEVEDADADVGRPWSVDHDAALTRKLLWKLDLRILPMMAILFLFSFLDRCVPCELLHRAPEPVSDPT